MKWVTSSTGACFPERFPNDWCRTPRASGGGEEVPVAEPAFAQFVSADERSSSPIVKRLHTLSFLVFSGVEPGQRTPDGSRLGALETLTLRRRFAYNGGREGRFPSAAQGVDGFRQRAGKGRQKVFDVTDASLLIDLDSPSLSNAGCCVRSFPVSRRRFGGPVNVYSRTPPELLSSPNVTREPPSPVPCPTKNPSLLWSKRFATAWEGFYLSATATSG